MSKEGGSSDGDFFQPYVEEYACKLESKMPDVFVLIFQQMVRKYACKLMLEMLEMIKPSRRKLTEDGEIDDVESRIKILDQTFRDGLLKDLLTLESRVDNLVKVGQRELIEDMDSFLNELGKIICARKLKKIKKSKLRKLIFHQKGKLDMENEELDILTLITVARKSGNLRFESNLREKYLKMKTYTGYKCYNNRREIPTEKAYVGSTNFLFKTERVSDEALLVKVYFEGDDKKEKQVSEFEVDLTQKPEGRSFSVYGEKDKPICCKFTRRDIAYESYLWIKWDLYHYKDIDDLPKSVDFDFEFRDYAVEYKYRPSGEGYTSRGYGNLEVCFEY